MKLSHILCSAGPRAVHLHVVLEAVREYQAIGEREAERLHGVARVVVVVAHVGVVVVRNATGALLARRSHSLLRRPRQRAQCGARSF